MKTALITGVTGQDGSYLAEFLLEKGYKVVGTMRKASQFNTQRVDHLYSEPHLPDTRFFLRRMDLTDVASVRSVVQETQPDEIYNLGGQSHVGVSFEMPQYTAETIYNGTLALLEAVRVFCPAARIYQASSSEMFGNGPPPQYETMPFRPMSPYAVAKTAAHHQCVNYRQAYGMFISCGILFNHESPRRGQTFVTRKITRAATRIKLGLQNELRLGNLDACRDWGFAGDYVEAMWLMLQHPEPDDFVIGTGESKSVRDFLYDAFELVDLDWRECVKFDPRLMRPSEVNHLCAYAAKASNMLKWRPTTSYYELVRMMIDADMKLAQQELLLKNAGH